MHTHVWYICTYQNGALPCGQGEDVGAGNDAGAEVLHVPLDVVDDLETADGVHVRKRGLLAGEVLPGHVVQKNGSVTSLKQFFICLNRKLMTIECK